MSVTYEARVRQARWIAGARVVLDLRIENRSAAPFETPDPMYPTSAQPHFELVGPGGRRQEFRPNSVPGDWGDQPPVLVRLAPGQHWEGDLPLSDYARLETPGHYTLRSWIETPGARIESPPSEFEIVRAITRALATEASLGENNTQVVECVELLEGGAVAGSVLDESDPRNAELRPFHRIERGATEPDAASILAPYSNFSVGLSALRWIVAEKNHKLIVGHNLTAVRRVAFAGAELSRFLAPAATQAGLYLAGVSGSELLLTRVTGSEEGVETGPVWTIEKLEAAPAAAAMTVSPPAAGDVVAFVLAWSRNDATRIRLLTVNPAGKIVARALHTLPDLLPLGPAAIGWSTSGELRASLLLRSAAKATEIRAAEFRFLPNLALQGAHQSSEPVLLGSPVHDAQVGYFESVPGQLRRMVLVRAAGGQAWVIPAEGTPRAPRTAIPSAGPLAILPGRMLWYAVWPDKGLLGVGPL